LSPGMTTAQEGGGGKGIVHEKAHLFKAGGKKKGNAQSKEIQLRGEGGRQEQLHAGEG